MSTLIKDKNYELVPGTPGTSNIVGLSGRTRGTPAYWSTRTVRRRVCTSTPCASDTGSVSLGGYNKPQPCSRAMLCQTTEVQEASVFHPAVPGTPGTISISGTSGTRAQLIEHLNEGWNSHSRSNDKLELGEYFSYKVNEGMKGVLVSIGVPGKSRQRINKFPKSILIENAGVLVFEDGVKVKTLKYSYSSDSLLRMYRQPDNKVACVVTTGTETLVHVFSNFSHGTSSYPLYIYVHMYLSGDVVKDSDVTTGKITFGKA